LTRWWASRAGANRLQHVRSASLQATTTRSEATPEHKRRRPPGRATAWIKHTSLLVREHSVVLDRELDELCWHGHLGRLALDVGVRDPARLARYPGEVEPPAAGDDRLVRLAQAPGSEPAQAVEDGVAEELDSVAG